MASSSRRIATQIPRVLEQGHAICSRKLYAARKIALVCFWVLAELEYLIGLIETA